MQLVRIGLVTTIYLAIVSAANHCNKMEFDRDSGCSSIQTLMLMLFMKPQHAK